MPITASQIKVTYRYTMFGQHCENIQYWEPVGAAFLTATMLGVLEALWANIEGAWHEILPANPDVGTFDSLLGEELGGGLSFAEFPIPSDEQTGDRAGLTATSGLPPFIVSASRQTVGTRVTRPGQKRIPFLADSDVIGNQLDSAAVIFFEPVHETFSTVRTLGAPVATGTLNPVIGGHIEDGVPTLWQPVTGLLMNPNASSQVSRKIGHGN